MFAMRQELPGPHELRALALAQSWLEAHRDGTQRALESLNSSSDAQRAAVELIRAEDTVISPAIEPPRSDLSG